MIYKLFIYQILNQLMNPGQVNHKDVGVANGNYLYVNATTGGPGIIYVDMKSTYAVTSLIAASPTSVHAALAATLACSIISIVP